MKITVRSVPKTCRMFLFLLAEHTEGQKVVLQFHVVHIRESANVHALKNIFNILKNIQNTYLVPLTEENGTSYT